MRTARGIAIRNRPRMCRAGTAPYARLKGFPWNADQNDVFKFFLQFADSFIHVILPLRPMAGVKFPGRHPMSRQQEIFD